MQAYSPDSFKLQECDRLVATLSTSKCEVSVLKLVNCLEFNMQE